ncbi:SDR family oxidoreductase [Actinoplanes sp. NPDC051494]|uniref:SDR family oxidoreductase n=1 Tax=Actinoplanes sp. NPDC051494 TaxID=3363907 RepID=UPI0037B76659
MTAQILITGGTGTLGRRVLPLLPGRVRVLTRNPRPDTDTATATVEHVTGDLATGEGIAHATEGVSTVLHLAGGPRDDRTKAHHLVRATGPRTHILFISVVGADRVPMVSRVDRAMFGYFAEQRAAERVIEDSGRPWTTLRATQFHDLLLLVVRKLAGLPVIPVPAGVRFQPVDADEVASRLAELALGPPRGLVADLAGPEVISMDAMIRSYLKATGRTRLLLPIRLGGRAYAAIREGANLAAPTHASRENDRSFRTEAEQAEAEQAEADGGRISWGRFLAGSLSSAGPAAGVTGR